MVIDSSILLSSGSGLSILSMLFDVLFMVQHFILYKDHRDEYREGTSSPIPPAKGGSPNLTPREIEAGEESPLLGAQRQSR